MLLKNVFYVLLMSLMFTETQLAFASPIDLHIISNSSWQSNDTFVPSWETLDFNDTSWKSARSPYPNPNSPTDIIPNTTASYIWYDPTNSSDGLTGPNEAYFRYTFNLDLQSDSLPILGQALIQVDDDYDLYVNETLRFQNHDEGFANVIDFLDFTSLLRNGKNVIAIHAKDGGWSNSRDRLYEDLLFDGVVKTANIPEPSNPLLLVTGIVGFAWLRKRESQS